MLLRSFSMILALGLLSACGDDGGGAAGGDGDDDGEDSGTPEPSELQDRLEACPEVSTSSDPTAGNCLEGAYRGTTLSGDSCSLTVGKAGVYQFSGGGLSVAYTPVPDTIFVFDHANVQGSHQVGWRVSDPLSTELWYELAFTARFGMYVQPSDMKLQIDLTEHREEGMTTVTCLVPL